MTLSEIKTALQGLDQITFVLPDGSTVPPHFHVTEVGEITKRFIDCGGTHRSESVINFQLYTATDYDHRLGAEKLRSIIDLSETQLGLADLPIEVEYQGQTIGKYNLAFTDGAFYLLTKKTDCLAKDKCGIPEPVAEVAAASSACVPGSGCC
jgi:hypothetical protein